MHLLLMVLALAAPPADWSFHDRATLDGCSLLTYRPVELHDQPVVPLSAGDLPASGVRYGLLPIGNVADHYPLVVWWPGAPGGPQVWIDADGDGRFDPAERHTLATQPLEVSLTIGVRSGEKVEKLKRTVLIRRNGDGLSYAVRGYAAGRLRFGDHEYAALLTDGNGDGCFDAAGTDRIWIDLDGDGKFDALTEQFLLGPPLSVAGRMYLVRPDARGTAVEVRERPAEQGSVRLNLPARISADRFAVQLVSDWGELVKITAAGKLTAVPVGRYHVDELRINVTDGRGKTWAYRFAGSRRCAVTVTAGRESTLAALEGLALGVNTSATIQPGEEMAVTPFVRTPAGLDLIDCRITDRYDDIGTMPDAEVRLCRPDGTVADRISSSFL